MKALHLRPGALLLLVALLWACGTNDSGGDRHGAGTQDASQEALAQDTARNVDSGGSDSLNEATPDLPAAEELRAETDAVLDTTETETEVEPTVRRFVVLHTGDEHGWIAPFEEGGLMHGGAANVAGSWAKLEGYDPGTHLVLSGGDSWSGAAISSWFGGEPTIAAMNAMGYDGVAVGNHEFDRGIEGLKARAAQADFPYLAANIREAASGLPVDWAEPFALYEVGGVTVGVVGLAGTHTPWTTFPAHVASLEFADYDTTLAEQVPLMRSAGAEVVIVLAHDFFGTMEALTASSSTPVDVVFAAHGHDTNQTLVNGITGLVPVVASGSRFTRYSALDITVGIDGRVDLDDMRVEYVTPSETGPGDPPPDPIVSAIVATWEAAVDEALGEEIGFTASGIGLGTWALANWTTDLTLEAFPEADIVISNSGGLRDDLDPGAITLADIVEVLPFENDLYLLSLTGEGFRQAIAAGITACGGGGCFITISGARYFYAEGGWQVSRPDGTPIGPDEALHVMVTDYMWQGGAGFGVLATLDPNPIETGILMRQPVIDGTRALHTSELDPLEAHVDPEPRNLPYPTR